MLSGVVYFLLLFFWWGWTYCAPNHLNLKSHSMPTCGCDWLPSLDGKTYDFISRNWIPLIFVASPFSPTSPPFGPLFHAFFPPQVGWVLRVPRYGRVCVCVWNIWTNVKLLIFIVSKRRGHSISLGLCPTKLPGKWDIQLGQLDVPAIRLFHFADMARG